MEIERKFLVTVIGLDLSIYRFSEIEQSYISRDPTIRIRKRDSEFILTIKGHATPDGLIREEWEMALTKNQYEQLRRKSDPFLIKKRRYLIPLDGELTAELDIYQEQLSGLKTVEVEFPSESAALEFCPPDWFGKEVTSDPRYSNAHLSEKGLP